MIDNILTGKKIAELRLRQGLTQQQLASILGVSHQAVSKWESGQALPDIQIMLALTQFFGITIEQLITEKGEIPPEEKPEDEESKEENTVNERAEVKQMSITKLLQMAPYMSREAVEEIALGIEEPITAMQLARLAPFLQPESIEALLKKHEPELNWEALRRLAPFLKRETVDAIARAIASGEATVKPNPDAFNKAMNDIGKALDDFGRGVEKTFDQIGKGIEKGFDDFGKGIEKGLRKAVRFSENVVNEVSKALDPEEGRRQEQQARNERVYAIRKKAFERALDDGRWDWIGMHISEIKEDAEMMGRIFAVARELGKHDFIREYMSDFADEQTVECAIAEQKWDWLGENIWKFGSDVHEKVALAAVQAGNWDWMFGYSDPLELVGCIEEIAQAIYDAGKYDLLKQFADSHMIETQVDALAEQAIAQENYEALDALASMTGALLREKLLMRLAQEEKWDLAAKYVKLANGDLLEQLMEIAVQQGNFDAIDMLDALL